MTDRWPEWSEHFSRVAADPTSRLGTEHVETVNAALAVLELACGLVPLPSPTGTDVSETEEWVLSVCWDTPVAVVVLDVMGGGDCVEWFWRTKANNACGGALCSPEDPPPRGTAEAMSLIRAGRAWGANETAAE